MTDDSDNGFPIDPSNGARRKYTAVLSRDRRGGIIKRSSHIIDNSCSRRRYNRDKYHVSRCVNTDALDGLFQ